jgi:spermidine synthase
MSFMGLLYGANTMGAVIGALLAGFVLLRLFNVAAATSVAVGLNLLVAVMAFGMARPNGVAISQGVVSDQVPQDTGRLAPIYATVALSGFCALGAEVIWTRLLSLMLGGTTYTFSMILAVFLLGLAVGSGAGALLASRTLRPGSLLSICQLLLVGGISWAAFMLACSLPYWPLNPNSSRSIWLDFQVDLLRCMWALFPATCLWGASFPLALAALAGEKGDPARLVGRLYFANTAGAILGAISFSLILIVKIGTQHSQQLLMVICALSGLLIPTMRLLSNSHRNEPYPPSFGVRQWAPYLSAGIIAGCLALAVPSVRWDLIAYGRYLPMKTDLGKVLFFAEGMNASVAVTELDTGVRNFHVSGKIEASTDQQDMRLQRMLGHLPALFHPDPRSILVVGCGAGVTAGSFLTHPGVQSLVLCEIEPIIPKAVALYFGEENYDVVQDPRVQFVSDDARNFLFTTRQKFDVITSDPIHPWVKGAAALYTREYFECCRKRLKPGGMVTQWVPLYESDLPTVKSEIATFFEVFPHGTIWSNENLGEGYDLVLLGQAEPLELDVAEVQQRLGRADHLAVAKSLRDVGIRSAFSLVATYAGQASDLHPWLRNAAINHDRDLRLQYLAGLGLNHNSADFIYSDLTRYRRFPEEIFVGSNLWNDALRRAMDQPHPNNHK